MAAYGKPQPPLNDAYYGPAIPPPQAAAYYGATAPPPPRRSGPHRLFCCLFKVIAVAVIALGAASIVLWLIFRPTAVKAYADTATLSRFSLNSTGGRRGGLLEYNLTVGMRVRNPNRFGISYRNLEAHASYDGDRFGFKPLQPFYVDKKSDAKLDVALSGAALVDDDDVERTYRRETAQGFYKVKLRVYARLGFKVRGFRMNNYKSKITCTLNLPVPSSGSGAAFAAPTMVFTKCDVNS
ncbi:NDR1/HIN1-like protein 10 [Oryza brachyantha]|uniref:NDR1/HIN1-like protein 10 n=1 Tax=Oryza brachyantha TaxID=4533 RepID=UPI001ADB4CBC|nr:NDR1/HIN1-like protein 10 [Oryza brachyantha]